MISLVMPIYKKEKVVRRSVTSVLKILDQLLSDSYELLAVVDGSPDASIEVLQKIKHPNLRVINYPDNKGKGYAIRKGFTEAQGEYIGFIDCGLDINPASLVYVLRSLVNNPIAVFPNRQHYLSVYKAGNKRKFISTAFNILRDILFETSGIDTQVGIKMFKAEKIKPILDQLQHDHWLFDVEIISALKFTYNFSFITCPVIIDMNREDESSQSVTYSSIVSIIFDMFKLSFRVGRLRYFNLFRPKWSTN